jgi:hypothetical protein
MFRATVYEISRLDEIRKYIIFEGSPDIIEVLNEFAEQDAEDSP